MPDAHVRDIHRLTIRIHQKHIPNAQGTPFVVYNLHKVQLVPFLSFGPDPKFTGVKLAVFPKKEWEDIEKLRGRVLHDPAYNFMVKFQAGSECVFGCDRQSEFALIDSVFWKRQTYNDIGNKGKNKGLRRVVNGCLALNFIEAKDLNIDPLHSIIAGALRKAILNPDSVVPGVDSTEFVGD